MKKLKPKGIKILKICHLLFVMMWLIGAVTMGLIYFVHAYSGDELYMAFKIMRFVDDFLLIPGAILTVVTAIIYGLYTNWGFFKHKWITVKWIVSITIIIVGTFVLSPWLDNCLDIAETMRESALTHPDLVRYSNWILAGAIIQSSLLILLVIISVFKPWKKTNKK